MPEEKKLTAKELKRQAELEKEALEVIETNPDLAFIDELAALMTISRATFYNYELDKLDIIKEKIANRKIDIKIQLRASWLHSDHASERIALYKLLATEEEWKRIQASKVDITSDDEKIQNLNFTVDSEGTAKIAKQLINNGSETD